MLVNLYSIPVYKIKLPEHEQVQKDFADIAIPYWSGAQTSNAGLGRAHAATLK